MAMGLLAQACTVYAKFRTRAVPRVVLCLTDQPYRRSFGRRVSFISSHPCSAYFLSLQIS